MQTCSSEQGVRRLASEAMWGPPTALCGRRSGGGGAARGATVGARAPSVQEAAGEVWGVDESGPYLGPALTNPKI
jgi:hypothetical protein